jgi:hypothetical protein
VLGVGAALATGTGVAHADDASPSAADSGASQQAKPHGLNQLKKDVSHALSAVSGATTGSPSSSRTARSSLATSNAATPRSVVTSVVSGVTKQVDSVTATVTGAAKRPFADFTGGASSTSSSTALVKPITSVPTQVKNALTGIVAANARPSTTTTAPAPEQSVDTPYGEIGKWLIQPGGDVSEWGGQPYQGKTLVEPINVIIVDPNSTSTDESTKKLNRDMTLAGFPAQPIHSTGFMGMINGQPYQQQPTGDEQAFSDNLFILPNDHARAFGPAPIDADNDPTTQEGYVWTVAASTETPGIYDGALTHSYVSYDLARDILVLRLLLTGQATFVGIQPMNNSYNTETETTGDHDGYAVVLALR